ncbi:MAG TPA: prolyl oligopeptidase family serine peptidase [Longimicrobiales bacterium]|nr:prolyl oligopeptidase family serine peptidase [Longimicrobiales bacterium]
MTRIPVFLAAMAMVVPADRASAQQSDPFLWLEEVESPEALDWVRSRNARTVEELSRSAVYQPVLDRAARILDSEDRIAMPSIRGEYLYNFWQDAEHERGIWRRTTWDSYVSGEPAWETVLDIDALAESEGVPWAWGGSTCLSPEYRLCLVRLSRGGADAVEVREFDTHTKQFVDDGFRLPEAKQSVDWIDGNTLLVATDFGEGSMTTSGYARVAKVWERGMPLRSARTIFEASPEDMGVWVGTWETADRRYEVVMHRPDFYTGTTHVLRDGELVKIDVPLDADLDVLGDRLLVRLRSPWTVGNRTLPAASLVDIDVDRFLEGARDFTVVLQPAEREAIESIATTRDYLLVSMLNNVRGELRRYSFADGSWSYETVPAPEMGSIDVSATSPFTNRYFFTYSGFTQPTTLYLSGDEGEVGEVQRMPEMFDASGLVVEQHEATSTDGTRIPYFIIHRQGMAHDGNNPTLLYAYGGFEVPMTPGYSAVNGAAWLERGGVYVVANIRGGGEFGPAWHRAGLKENRQRIYDDFIAVAEALIDHGVTSPEHLGIMGGSNGGLLVGVAFTQRPDLFDAVVVQVPLLDMRRYNRLLAGASWMAEYGNPDVPEEWAYISRYSPYQNLKEGVDYPRVLFTTTTRDDRVHPGHARKMAAKMEAMGYPYYYFEQTEGGHGSGVTTEQRAQMYALTYAYLWEQLATEPAT